MIGDLFIGGMHLHREDTLHVEKLKEQRKAAGVPQVRSQEVVRPLPEHLRQRLSLQGTIRDEAGMVGTVREEPCLADRSVAWKGDPENLLEPPSPPKPILIARCEPQRIEGRGRHGQVLGKPARRRPPPHDYSNTGCAAGSRAIEVGRVDMRVVGFGLRYREHTLCNRFGAARCKCSVDRVACGGTGRELELSSCEGYMQSP